jgi:molybdopterin-guanine dinucleotide biosynthesis protein A
MGGINKSLVDVGGVTVINRILDTLQPLFGEIILAGWPEGDPVPGGVITVKDNYPGKGPLAGIEAALRITHSPALFVFGGDMPWLSPGLIGEQAADYLNNPSDIQAARFEGFLEPLHSVYSRKIHPLLAGYLEGGGNPAIIDFYKIVSTRFYDLPPTTTTRKALTNINNPGDIEPQV